MLLNTSIVIDVATLIVIAATLLYSVYFNLQERIFKMIDRLDVNIANQLDDYNNIDNVTNIKTKIELKGNQVFQHLCWIYTNFDEFYKYNNNFKEDDNWKLEAFVIISRASKSRIVHIVKFISLILSRIESHLIGQLKRLEAVNYLSLAIPPYLKLLITIFYYNTGDKLIERVVCVKELGFAEEGVYDNFFKENDTIKNKLLEKVKQVEKSINSGSHKIHYCIISYYSLCRI